MFKIYYGELHHYNVNCISLLSRRLDIDIQIFFSSDGKNFNILGVVNEKIAVLFAIKFIKDLILSFKYKYENEKNTSKIPMKIAAIEKYILEIEKLFFSGEQFSIPKFGYIELFNGEIVSLIKVIDCLTSFIRRENKSIDGINSIVSTSIYTITSHNIEKINLYNKDDLEISNIKAAEQKKVAEKQGIFIMEFYLSGKAMFYL